MNVKQKDQYKINIYKIYWDNSNDIFVGSTKNRLCLALGQHRQITRNGSQKSLHIAMRNNDYNGKIVLLEIRNVVNIDQQKQFTKEWSDYEKANLNVNREKRKRKIKLKIILK